MSRKLTAFIDGDILLHRALSFTDREFDGEPMNNWKQALGFYDDLLNKWLKEARNPADYYVVLSVGKNFRKDLYPDYKANRKDIEPHPAFPDLKKEVMDRLETVWEEGIEADDLIGIRCSEDPKRTLAVSADKDFATVPCRLCVPTSHGRKTADWYEFSEAQADLNWLRQAMTGDTIDNYKGIQGCGPVKAAKILEHEEPLEHLWAKVLKAFTDAEMTEDDALTMARLARILRAGDYNFETKEVRLWTPSNLTMGSASGTE